MWNFTKRTIHAEMLQPEEQPGSKKPNIGRPFSQNGSSFRPWQPSWKKGLGIAEASSSGGPHVANFNKTAVQDNNNMNMENSNPDHADKNPINVGGATSGVGAAGGGGGDDDNAAGTDAAQIGSGSTTQPDMDPKRLKRILANRASAQRSRLRKNEYMADLEDKAKTFKNKICFLQPQIEAHKNRQRLLQIEQHQLRLQMAIREKQRVLQEVEIEKKKAEVNRLSEVQRKQIAEARMQNTGAAMHHISNSNMNPSSGFGRLFCLNPNQAQNGVETSRLQTAISQEPQNQSQMWMGKWNNGQTSTPNLNFVKSKPANK